jgi:hypothetical protein
MGMATHLGPWLLGTVKNSTASMTATNAAAGLVRNTGVTQVAQSVAITFSNATFGAATPAFVLPAGTMITDAHILLDTAFTGGTVSAATLKYSIGGTDITTAPSVFSTLGNINLPTAATQAAAFMWRNVSTTNTTTGATGTSDVVVNYTITLTGAGPTTGSATLVIQYVVRNPDGSATPAST